MWRREPSVERESAEPGGWRSPRLGVEGTVRRLSGERERRNLSAPVPRGSEGRTASAGSPRQLPPGTWRTACLEAERVTLLSARASRISFLTEESAESLCEL